jgi:hypothetical protein
MDNRIYLTQGKVAFVDEKYVIKLINRSWQAHKSPDKKTWYARRTDRIDGVKVTIQMHQLIADWMGLIVPFGYVLDHIDRDGLNNREENIRVVTYSQSCANQTRRYNTKNKYIGVDYIEIYHCKVRIQHDGIQENIDVYDTEENAARVRDILARKYHGEAARLNFPDE